MNRKSLKLAAATVEKAAGSTRKLRDKQENLPALGGEPIVPVSGPAETTRQQLAKTQGAILDALPPHIAIALLDADGVIVTVNEAWQRFEAANALQGSGFGIGRNYVALCEADQSGGASEARQVAAKLREILNGTVGEFSLDYCCHSPTQERWFRVMLSAPHRILPKGVLVTHIDITEQKLAGQRLFRINQLYAVLSGVNEAIVRTRSQTQLFEQVCRIATGAGLFRMAAVMAVNETAGMVQPLTHAGAEGGYFAEISINLTDRALSNGTVGTAVRTKVYDVCNDTLNDPRMGAWRESCRRHGYLSTASFPILHEGKVTAVLVLFASQARYFADDELKLLVSVQENLSFAVESLHKEAKQRQAEAALVAAQRQQKQILQSVGEGIHVLDAAGRIVFENATSLAMFGWGEAEMQGRPAHALVHHHRMDGREYRFEDCPIHQTLRDGQVRRVEDEVFFRKDGSQFPVEYVCSPVRDEIGAISGVVVCFQDVSERNRTAEAMRAQATMLDNAQRIGCMGTWCTDLRLGRVTWSQATCALFGITLAEFRGTFEHFCSFILPEDLPAFNLILAGISPAKPLLEAEFRIRRRDGSVRWMYERGNVEFDSSGSAIRRIGMIMDVTGQRLAREQSERDARLLSIAGKAARLGGWAIELPERRLTWSDETCILHDLPPGYQPSFEEGVGYFPVENRFEVLRHVETCARDGTPYDFEAPKITAKGRRIWVRCIGEAVRDENGKIIRLQGAFQDITERKQSELALSRSNRALRMLSACGEALTHLADENQLLAEVCRVAVEIGGYRMAWVGYALDDVNRTVQPMAHAGMEDGYLTVARINWSENDAAGLGPGGNCIRTGRLAYCANIDNESSSVFWRQEAQARGYRSIICLPLRQDHCTFGILALYSAEVFQAEAGELQLFKELGDDLSFGINNLRARGQSHRGAKDCPTGRIARQGHGRDFCAGPRASRSFLE